MNSTRRDVCVDLLRGAGLGALGSSALGLAGCMRPPGLNGEPLLAPSTPEASLSRRNEPALRVGQGWEFKETNLFNGEGRGTVLHRVDSLGVNMSGEQALRLSLRRDHALTHEVFTARWLCMQESHHDASLRFESPVALIPSQLRVGHKEHYATRYVPFIAATTSPDLNSAVPPVFRDLRWEVYLEVLGWESLQVPAGRFDVARIQRHIYFKHFDHFRLNSVRQETLWYAPQLGYWVAREWTGRYYSPGSLRRAGPEREDWVRWELTKTMGPPSA
jgi:hypothetical protein